MMVQLKRLIAPLVLAGIAGGVSIQPALAAANGPRCHIEFSPSEVPWRQPRGEFIVRSAGRRGAVGIWEDRTGDRLRVRVEPGEGEASKGRAMVGGHEYDLVRCETVR